MKTTKGTRYTLKGNVLLEKLKEFEKVMIKVADETGEELTFNLDEQNHETLDKCFKKINETALNLGVKKTATAFLCFSLSHKEPTELQEFIEDMAWGHLHKINDGKFADQVDEAIMNILRDMKIQVGGK